MSEIAATPIEQYLARPAHGGGMTFQIEFPVEGPLDAQAMAAAWRDTCRGHPRTRSRLSGRSWILAGEAHVEVQSGASGPPADVDVRAGRGAVMTIAPLETRPGQPPRCRLTWRFQHAVCDGYGGCRLMFQCLRRYHRRFAATPSRGDRASRSNRPGAKVAASATPASPDLRHLGMTVAGRNVRLGPVGGAADPIDANDVLFWRLNEEDSRSLRVAIREAAVPLNDVGVSAAMEAIAAVSDDSKSSRVMILNPTQARDWSQRRDTTNHLGMILPRRRLDELGDWGRTHASIGEQLRDVRRHRYDRDLPAGIAMLGRVWGGWSLADRLGKFTPTASLTCLSSFHLVRQGRFSINDVQPIQSKEPIQSVRSPADAESARLRPAAMSNVGPIQAGGALSITLWDDGQQIAASFRYAHPELRPITCRIVEAWAHIFEQIRRGVWSLTS